MFAGIDIKDNGRDSGDQASGSVKSASEMPGATARRLAAPAVPSPESINDAPDSAEESDKGRDRTSGASQDMPFSARRTSFAAANCIFTVTAARLFNLPPVLGNRASANLLCSSR